MSLCANLKQMWRPKFLKIGGSDSVLTHCFIFILKSLADEYLDTVSKVYYSYFRSYLQRLMKLKFAETATKHDMIGHVDTPMLSKFSSLSITKAFSRQSIPLKQKETVFTLGNRKMVIESELEAPVIVPHAERIQEQSHRTRVTFYFW